MDIKDKIISLTKHLNNMIDRLNNPTPEKHKNRVEQFKAFLKKEIESTKAKIESFKG